ncbi:MAG: hypothetical protein FIA97_13630 [Methylococcaceae bacterium]|nr:hypothetical protein [Methylococcaceae bacterium]
MRSATLAALLVTFSSLAIAAAPAGAPTPGANPHAAPVAAPADLPHEGTVVSTIDASTYTYVEVSEGGQTQWLAGTAIKLKKGDKIRYSDGTVMKDFYSKTLDRTFPTVLFVNSIVPVP